MEAGNREVLDHQRRAEVGTDLLLQESRETPLEEETEERCPGSPAEQGLLDQNLGVEQILAHLESQEEAEQHQRRQRDPAGAKSGQRPASERQVVLFK